MKRHSAKAGSRRFKFGNMKLALKILISLPLVALMLFSVFGFLAAFELRSPNVWHAVYLLAFLLLAGLGQRIWRQSGRE